MLCVTCAIPEGLSLVMTMYSDYTYSSIQLLLLFIFTTVIRYWSIQVPLVDNKSWTVVLVIQYGVVVQEIHKTEDCMMCFINTRTSSTWYPSSVKCTLRNAYTVH